MTAVFPAPQFPLRPDSFGSRFYANTSNTLSVETQSGVHHVALAIPTGLFTLMRFLDVSVDETVQLGIALEERDEDVRYVFYMLIGEDRLFDLWEYSSGSVPGWIFDPQYRV